MIRPLLRLSRLQSRAFTSHQHPPASASTYTPTETLILTSALTHVPTSGFTTTALAHGARDNGYLDISINLFPRGAFELVRFHLVTQRLGLAAAAAPAAAAAGVAERVRALCVQRLRGNTAVVRRWQEALALMSLGENVPAAVAELALLSDEVWFLAGERAVDTSWYTKRAALAAVYASTELYMTTDTSSDFEATWEFLDRRLGDVEALEKVAGGLGSYVGFTANAVGNILRAKNMRMF